MRYGLRVRKRQRDGKNAAGLYRHGRESQVLGEEQETTAERHRVFAPGEGVVRRPHFLHVVQQLFTLCYAGSHPSLSCS